MIVKERKPEILKVASELLQSRSFAAFSYQDLSDRLGISKASIHHHFPTKDQLLVALSERYQKGYRGILSEIDRTRDGPWERLDAYLEATAAIMYAGNKICPMGALQAEYNIIPDRARDIVKATFRFGKTWLAGVLAEGRERGVMVFAGSAEERASLVLAALQGGLQIARAVGPKEFTEIVQQIRASLRPGPSAS